MRRTPAVPAIRLSIPDHWLNKVSVGQVLTIGQYPNQEKYEILYVNRPLKFVTVKPLKH